MSDPAWPPHSSSGLKMRISGEEDTDSDKSSASEKWWHLRVTGPAPEVDIWRSLSALCSLQMTESFLIRIFSWKMCLWLLDFYAAVN